jgi:chromosome segregation ATPase
MEESAIIFLCLVSSFAIMSYLGYRKKKYDLSEKELFLEKQETKNAEAEAKVKAHWEEYIDTKSKMVEYKKNLDTANEVIRHQAVENDSLRAVIRGMSREIKDTHDHYFDVKAEVENA